MAPKFIITGGVASGKSTIVEFLKQSYPQVQFFSFDEYTRVLYENDDVKEFLQNTFGTAERSKISNIVFADPKSMEILNEFFLSKVISVYNVLISANKPMIIEMPLFHDLWKKKHIRSELNVYVITVGCSYNHQIERVMNRDGCTEEKAKAIIRSQVAREFRIGYSHLYVDTSGDISYNRINEFIGNML